VEGLFPAIADRLLAVAVKVILCVCIRARLCVPCFLQPCLSPSARACALSFSGAASAARSSWQNALKNY